MANMKIEGPSSESNRRFEIPGMASVTEGNGGMQKVNVQSPEAAGEIYLHGAHLTSWKPAGREEVLFLSSQSRWEQGRAIRGGVPICFPWFGAKSDDPKAPAHGFARTKAWEIESIVRDANRVTVSLFTGSDAESRRWWPGEFRAVYRVSFGAELRLELAVANIGTAPLRFEEALHTYHRVGDIRKARLAGLNAVQYVDKTDSNLKKIQQGEIEVVSETDRVYLNTRDAIELQDSVLGRRTHVAKENSSTTVIWNPWAQKSIAMADFANDEWIQMVCIETSNVSDFAVDLAPGQQHTMGAIVRVADI